MKVLSLDTSTRAGSIALMDASRVVVHQVRGIAGGHAETLFSTIDHLLEIAQWQRSDLEGIVVALGPGSFMGLRTGIAAAKGLALSLKLPLVGIGSLLGLAAKQKGFQGKILSVIDAKRKEVYAALYDGVTLDEIYPPQTLSPESLHDWLQNSTTAVVAVGDGVDCLPQGIVDQVVMIPESERIGAAAAIAILAAPRLAQGGDDLAALVPDYIRQSDAQIGFLGRGV